MKDLRPLDFKEQGDTVQLGCLDVGSFFKFKKKKTIYRLDSVENGEIKYSTYSTDFSMLYNRGGAIEIVEMLPNKPKVLLSFSGGETSAWMAYYVYNKYRDIWDIKLVFANTGQENEKTLIFVKKFSDYFKIPITWVESVVSPIIGVGIRHKEVNFESATRDISLFENAIKKYGIFNRAHPKCTQYLKSDVIKSYTRSIGWGTNYYLAIGIRIDEIDRISIHRHKNKIFYPPTEIKPMTKKKINGFWKLMPFRLGLKGWEGNCKVCFKKSEKKLIKIAQDTPEYFEPFKYLEFEYGDYVPMNRDSSGWVFPITFYREHKTAQYYLDTARLSPPIDIIDDADEYEESCEVFTNCGEDN